MKASFMDAFLSVLIGITQLVLGGMGIYMALRPPDRKYHWYWIGAFIGVGLIGIGLTFWIAKRASAAQEENASRQQKLQENLDKSLLKQAEMSGHLQAIQSMMASLSKSDFPGMKEFANALSSALNKQSEQNLKEHLASNQDLCRTTSVESERIRDFQAGYEQSEESLDDKYFNLFRNAKNQEEKLKLANQQTQDIHQLWQDHERDFKNEYMGAAKYIKDEILDRLPSNERASILVNNDQAESNLNSGELAGAFNEDRIATYLDVLSQSLCSEKAKIKPPSVE